jgi:hypothetical protein
MGGVGPRPLLALSAHWHGPSSLGQLTYSRASQRNVGAWCRSLWYHVIPLICPGTWPCPGAALAPVLPWRRCCPGAGAALAPVLPWCCPGPGAALALVLPWCALVTPWCALAPVLATPWRRCWPRPGAGAGHALAPVLALAEPWHRRGGAFASGGTSGAAPRASPQYPLAARRPSNA